MTTPATAAFSDVDETLVRVKSMFRFLEFYLRVRGEPATTYQRLVGGLRNAARRGAPRSDINRAYYRLFQGEDAERLATAGRRWFAHEWQEMADGLFISEVEEALTSHRKAGEALVLVSGSFFACLDPIAEDIGADQVIGTRPVVRRGELTGEVLVPMIGATKGRAVQITAALRGFDLARCSGYGDHISDLPMLKAVGNPVVVGDNFELAAIAMRARWNRLMTGQQRR